MAQTSLIIGDTNWAVKEDSLLGYNVIQNNYLPIPIDCVRATTATRVNEQGLIEIVPRNLLQYSQDYNNGAWAKSDMIISPNLVSAPNGTITAQKVIANTNNLAHVFYQAIPTGTYSFSIYAKAGEETLFSMWLSDFSKRAVFDLSTGTIIGSNVTNSTITNAGNGWYRCTVYDNSLTSYIAIYGRNGASYIGNGINGMYFWGAQTEVGSVATEYFPTTNRLDIPRIDYSTGTASLLVEPQRTNVVLQSEDLTAPNWVGYRVDITPNQTTSPNGTTNADLIADTATSGTHWFEPSFSATNGTSYTLSYFVKANTLTQCTIYGWSDNGVFAGQQAIFNLTNGTVLSNIGNGIPNIVSYANGWYRVSLTLTSTATATGYWAFGLAKNGVSNYLGNGSSLYIWGVQLEAGSYATSYIPTIASSVTRNADIINRTGISSLIGQTEGTIFLDLVFPQKNDASYIGISNGTTANRIIFGAEAGDFYTFGYASATFSLNINTRYKIALAYNSTNMLVYINGVLSRTLTGTVPSGMSRFALDNGQGNQNFIGTINSAQLYKTKLSTIELAQLTTI